MATVVTPSSSKFPGQSEYTWKFVSFPAEVSRKIRPVRCAGRNSSYFLLANNSSLYCGRFLAPKLKLKISFDLPLKALNWKLKISFDLPLKALNWKLKISFDLPLKLALHT